MNWKRIRMPEWRQRTYSYCRRQVPWHGTTRTSKAPTTTKLSLTNSRKWSINVGLTAGRHLKTMTSLPHFEQLMIFLINYFLIKLESDLATAM